MRSRQNGFSLIELVVALAILAAATTIALRATSHLEDQARYKATTSTLNNIQAAILGPTNERSPDGTPLVSGFVADTGRPPQFYISGSDPLGASGDPLTELLQNPNSIPSFQRYSSNVDPSVKVWVGWQGPYLHLGAGPTYTRDGWGNSVHAYDSSGNVISTAGTQIAQIASWGSQNTQDVNHGGSTPIANNYTDDVSIPNPTITGTTSGFAANATIIGQVTMDIGSDPAVSPATQPSVSGTTPNPTFTGTPVAPSSSSPATASSGPVSIWVDYIGPDLTQSPNPVADVPQLVAITNSSGAWVTPGTSSLAIPYSGQFSISASNVTIGPRVLKAYLLPDSITTLNDFTSYVQNATSATPASTPGIYAESTLNVTLTGGAQTINLVLPHYSP